LQFTIKVYPSHDGQTEQIGKTSDVVKEGQKVWVKLLGFDERGKVRLSMKVVDQETGKEVSGGGE
jgi:polyribonucleotide nucleotidyltransferase